MMQDFEDRMASAPTVIGTRIEAGLVGLFVLCGFYGFGRTL